MSNNNHHNMSIKDSSPHPLHHHHHLLELGLGLSIGGFNTNLEEASSSSSSSSSVNIHASSIVGTNRTTLIHSVSPNATTTSVVGWPPIRKAHRLPIMSSRIKSEHEQDFTSTNITNRRHRLTVKVNMDGTLIGRKLDLYAHTSYQTLAHTLQNMFHGTWSSDELLNGTSEFVLTYEDKDGDCMLVGDVPWQMFLSSVKRLRILRNPKMQR